LAFNITNKKAEIVQVHATPFSSDSPESDDPFFKWLRDEKSVTIDWNTYGIDSVQSESCTRFYLRIPQNAICHPGFFQR
jgi:hypothetical protein